MVGIPFIWSIICTILRYGLYAILQSVLLQVMFGSVAGMETAADGYALQTVSSVTFLVLAQVLYRLGKGFSFPFERRRFKFEDITVLLLIIVFFCLITTIFYINQLWINIVFFALIAGYLTYFAIQRENEDT